MTPRPREAGLKVAATVVAVGVNGVLFGGMALAGMIRGQEEEPPPHIDVEIVEIVQKGEERPKHLLPRKPAAPAPEPPPEAEVVRTAPPEEELEKQKEEEEKKRRAEEERKRREEEERKRKEEEERRRKAEEERKRKEEERKRRARQRAMQEALASVQSEDAPEGHPDGMEGGNTTDPTKSAKFLGYIGQLSLILQRHFEVPAVIPHDERPRLVCEVSFRLGPDGKVRGEPRITKSSGNRFFDDAALRAVKKFGPGTPLKLPLPGDPKLKAVVLKSPLRPNLHGR